MKVERLTQEALDRLDLPSLRIGAAYGKADARIEGAITYQRFYRHTLLVWVFVLVVMVASSMVRVSGGGGFIEWLALFILLAVLLFEVSQLVRAVLRLQEGLEKRTQWRLDTEDIRRRVEE